MHRTIWRCAAVFLLLLAGAACGGGDDEDGDAAGATSEESAEANDDSNDNSGSDDDNNKDSSSGSDDNDSDDTMKIETDDGTFEVGSGELPDDWPKDFPMPDDVKVISSSTQSGDGNSAMTVALSSKDGAKDVFDYYVDALDDAGYEVKDKISGSSNGDFGGSMGFTKGDLQGTVVVGEGSGDEETGMAVTIYST